LVGVLTTERPGRTLVVPRGARPGCAALPAGE
jgi:hypothetical protein